MLALISRIPRTLFHFFALSLLISTPAMADQTGSQPEQPSSLPSAAANSAAPAVPGAIPAPLAAPGQPSLISPPPPGKHIAMAAIGGILLMGGLGLGLGGIGCRGSGKEDGGIVCGLAVGMPGIVAVIVGAPLFGVGLHRILSFQNRRAQTVNASAGNPQSLDPQQQASELARVQHSMRVDRTTTIVLGSIAGAGIALMVVGWPLTVASYNCGVQCGTLHAAAAVGITGTVLTGTSLIPLVVFGTIYGHERAFLMRSNPAAVSLRDLSASPIFTRDSVGLAMSGKF